MRETTALCAALAVAYAGSGLHQARADITSTHGDMTVAANPPLSVESGAWESTGSIRVFQEAGSLALTRAVTVDFSTTGMTYDDRKDFSPANLAEDTIVDSYLVHVDPVRRQSFWYSGSVTFEREILGIIVTWKNMKASNLTLAAEGTKYLAQRGFGIEIGRDKVDWSVDGKSLTFWGHARPKIDQIRVLTKPFEHDSEIPTPGALSGLVLGAGLLGSRRQRRSAP